MFARERAWEMDHIADARWCDALVVAPATANILGKMAHGIADCPVSTLYLACEKPTLVAPAMNHSMWRHPAVQANVALLRARGAEFAGPGEGRLACGEVGYGRMSEPAEIAEALAWLLGAASSLAGKRVLITAGPTREFLDPARCLTNPSTGKMGYALARQAARRGAVVQLVSGPTALDAPAGVERICVVSAAQMLEAVQARFADCDIAIFAAAPADFRPAVRAEHKVKKHEAGEAIRLERTEDIAAWCGRNRRADQILAGFAAETRDTEANALEKLRAKNLDFIVANDVSRPDIGFAADENEAALLCRDGRRVALARQSKEAMAGAILDTMLPVAPNG
ncbi:MAG: Coenzyme A biosynthesis bifunctional protein CoaBC [candidate division BRC1 bacterium ADurb.BinA364]|nr:MAG: Coenzyme A biosynthesis bifunctional protein CoaBC [candidate division BRC1 bacterium ADurb.BinA364]